MFNLGGMEILVILVVALLVLGPEKLPKFMRTMGKAVGELRRASTEFQRTVNTELTGDAKQSVSGPPAALAPEETAPGSLAPDQVPPGQFSSKQTPSKHVPQRRPLPRARRPRARKHYGAEEE